MLIYEGPRGSDFEITVGAAFQPDPNVCRGWCNQENWRQLAVSILMDSSEFHIGLSNGREIAVGLLAEKKPTDRGRTVMYAPGIGRVVATDHVLVACCHRIGSHLVHVRRCYPDMLTDNRFKIWWEKAKKYDGVQV
jgi:hypothetical protein